MRIQQLREAARRRRYDGPPLEAGGTSIQGGAAPGLRWLENQGVFSGAKKILDYGAGKYGRNAEYLRSKGFKVYSYDPFNGKPGADGWSEVSTKLPRAKFDVGFTSFVLNVVPEYIEQEIVGNVGKLSRDSYHLVRNDIFPGIKKALMNKHPLVGQFFLDQFATPREAKLYEAGQLTDKIIFEFCQHGTPTTRGFQRNPTAEDYGLTVVYSKGRGITGGDYKIYKA